MKIVFFGTPSFVDPVLETLEANFEVIEKIRKPQKSDHESIERLKKLNPDFFVVAAYGQIFPKELLEIPKSGAINIHPSLLPLYRGPTPIQTAILNGDQKTGVSFIKMDTEVDHGEILAQKECEIMGNETSEDLLKRIFAQSAVLLEEVLPDYVNGKLFPKTQDDTKATFTKSLNKNDGYVDLEKPPDEQKLERMIRAYYPWPGVWTKFKLTESEVIIKLLPDERVQVEGKNPMSYKDFKNGYEKGEEFLKKLNLS